ncbi:hypothetical protein SAMN05444507_108175 [Pseudomonas syringae]|nr:hypothetical protein SAMN05444062_109175 [Pseudomonas syringae]SFI45756.1 hypothetical protein SAMN05444507_108175 [Pseudomonas syringae]
MHVIIHQGVRGANYLYRRGRVNAGGGSADEPLQTLKPYQPFSEPGEIFALPLNGK